MNDAPATESAPTNTPAPRFGKARGYLARKPRPEPKPRKPRVAKPIRIFKMEETAIILAFAGGSVVTESEAREWIKEHGENGGTYRIVRELASVTVKTETVTRVTLE